MITYILVFVAAIAAASILLMKEVFHAALALIICLLCVAGIFVTFNAEFLAVVQIVVYAGGVLLLIIFGIMLTVKDPVSNISQNKIISSVIGIALLAIFVYALGDFNTETSHVLLSPEEIGTNLISNFLIEFELAGMLLLISLIGAIVAATNLGKK